MKVRLDHVVVALITVGVALFYAFGQGTYALLLFANYGLILFGALAGLVGLVSYLQLGRSKMGLFSLGFAVGLLLWMPGLAVYTYTYLIAGVDLPYLSLADVFYLLSYPPILLGCIGLLREFRSSLERVDWLTTAIVGVLFYLLVALYAVVPSVQALEDPLEILVTALYPSLDVLILALLLPVLLAFRKGIFRAPFALLALGAALVALGDLAFTYVNLVIGYYDGHPIDLLWFTGFIAYGYGFWRQHAGFSFRR